MWGGPLGDPNPHPAKSLALLEGVTSADGIDELVTSVLRKSLVMSLDGGKFPDAAPRSGRR